METIKRNTSIKLSDYVKASISNKEMTDIINAYEEDRGCDGEFVADLEYKKDYDIFVGLYGSQSVERMKKECRFWLGGYNFYCNNEDRMPCRCTKTIPATNSYLNVAISGILDGIYADKFDETLKANNYDIDYAIEYYTNMFYNLVNFASYAKDAYRKVIKYTYTINGMYNGHNTYTTCDKEFDTKEDALKSARENLTKLIANTDYKSVTINLGTNHYEVTIDGELIYYIICEIN